MAEPFVGVGSTLPAIIVRTNLPDFQKQLDAFKGKVQTTIVRRALSAAAKVFKAAVIAAAPKLKTARKGKSPRVPGVLRKSIYAFHMRPKPGLEQYVVSFKKKNVKSDPFYGRFLEDGWMPRGPGRRLKGGVAARRQQRRRNLAAGHRRVAYPFIAPAFKRSRDAALEAFSATMQTEIDKASREK